MLEIEIAGIKMKNPFMLASGILDLTKESMEKFKDAGAVVTKSIGKDERKGYKNPVFHEVECGILNAIGLANPGVEEYVKEIKGIKIENLIGSIFGKDEKEFYYVAEKMMPFVKAFELNLSCPHAKKVGMEYSTRKIKKTVEEVKQLGKPVFVKLGMENLLKRAEKAIEGGADAIVAINSVKAMAIAIDVAMPVLGNKVGGYSGKAIKPIGVRCVYELAKNFDLPIIGVGGITYGRDVIEYMMAGASAVQVGTAIYYRGEKIFRLIEKETKEWLKENGYRHIGEIIGLALKN